MTPKDFDAIGLCDALRLRARRRRRERADLAPLSPRSRARRNGAAADLRLRRLWPRDGRQFLHQPASPWSTAASSTRSPMCAAARKKAGAGTRTASWPTSPTPSAISSPPRAILSPRASPRKDRVVAHGGSAGGMLMGAIANMAPELYAGDHRRCAVRRRAQHHARRQPAAHAAGMAGMGRSRPQRRSLRRDPRLQPL